jgi:hypothetical protein
LADLQKRATRSPLQNFVLCSDRVRPGEEDGLMVLGSLTD